MKKIIIEKDVLSPSSGQNSFIQDQFDFRKTGEFKSNDNRVAVLKMEESVWWNRPLDSDKMVRLEEGGLYSYNLPFLGDRDEYKTGYNLLLPKGGIAVISHIKFDEETAEQIRGLIYDCAYNTLFNSLVELGVPIEKLYQTRNDILLNGKKVSGEEKKIENNVFTENMIITMSYLSNIEDFENLTGKYAKVRGITGITDEYPEITTEVLMNKLYDNIKKLYEELKIGG